MESTYQTEDTNNGSTYSTSKDIPLDEEGCLAVYGVICFLGVLFNTVTIIIIICGERFGKSVKLQLLNLAITDLLSALLVPTYSLLTNCVTSSYPNNLMLCRAHLYVAYTILYAGLLSNALIAVERFVAVYFPLKMLDYKRKHFAMTIVAMWTVSFLLQINTMNYGGLEESRYRKDALICIQQPQLQPSGILLATSIHAIKYLFPTFIILLSYGLISIKLKTKPRIGETQRKLNTKVGFTTRAFSSVIYRIFKIFNILCLSLLKIMQ